MSGSWFSWVAAAAAARGLSRAKRRGRRGAVRARSLLAALPAWLAIGICGSLVALSACGDDESLSPRPSLLDASGGASGSGGTAGTGGRSGAGGAPDAGRDSSLEPDATDARDSGRDAEAGTEQRLSVCRKPLSEMVEIADTVPPRYMADIRADCRVQGHIEDHFINNTLHIVSNPLPPFNLSLWGCNLNPLTSFPLAVGATRFTTADAAAMIDLYVRIVADELQLTVPEQATLRQILGQLSQLAVTEQSSEYSRSSCTPDDAGESDASARVDAGEEG
jgi:hypothetical protein